MKKRKAISFLLTICMALAIAAPTAFAGTKEPAAVQSAETVQADPADQTVENAQANSVAQTAETARTMKNGQTFADMKGHWAAAVVSKWAGLGIVKGDSGSFRPDDPITRSEFAAILDNLMGYQTRADNTFTDVKSDAWYAEAVLKANAAGILNGDGAGHAAPDARVSREQAAVMLARAFGVDESTGAGTAFHDASSVSSWAKGLVFGMEADRYIGGMGNGSFEPQADITRAQAVTVIDNAVAAYYSAAGVYTENVEPKTDGANCVAIVRTGGVTLRGAHIAGDLIVAEGVGGGDFTLDGAVVEGKLIARGGGENSIHIINGADVKGKVSVEKKGGVVRIVSDGVVIASLEADAEVILEGSFTNVSVAAGASVAVRGSIENLEVTGKAEIKAEKGAKIGAMKVESDARGTNLDIDKNAEVGRLEASTDMTTSGAGAPKTVTGTGSVTGKNDGSSAGTGVSSGGGGNGGGNNGGGNDTTDKRSISIKKSDQTATEIAGEESSIYVDFTGTDTAGNSSMEVLSGELTVKDGENPVDASNYSLSAGDGYLSFEPDYIAGLSEGKHVFTYSFKTNDGKVFAASSTLYLIPDHAVILYDQPEGCTLKVTDNDTSEEVSSGSSVGINWGNSIEIKLSGLSSGKHIKSAIVTNSYYGQTETYDIAYDLAAEGEVQYFSPKGTMTIKIVTEDIPSDLPEIAGVEFYLGYDYNTDTYSNPVTTEIPSMLLGDNMVLLYARVLLENGETTRFANYTWSQQVIGETTSTTPVSYANFCAPYAGGNTEADSVITLTVSGYDGYTRGPADGVTTSIIVRKPLQWQSSPTNLTAGSVSSPTAKDGKIIGTTADMEYKLSTAAESAYANCGNGETTGLVLGTYDVRLKAKAGYAAGWPTEVEVLMTQAAPAGLTGLSPSSPGGWDSKISGTTTGMEWREASGSGDYAGCADGTTFVNGPGTYYVRYRAVDGQYYASEDTTVIITPYVDQDQAAPTGLTTTPATHATSSDGRILGTTPAMEYKLSTASDSAYANCGSGETAWLKAGTYLVRFKAKTGYNASPGTEVTIGAPAASSDAALQELSYICTYDGAQEQASVPGFDPSITEYNISLYGNVYGKTFNLNPYADDPGYATVSYSAVTVNTGEYTAVLKAEVTAEDGQTTKTYTVNITVERRSGTLSIAPNVYSISSDTVPVLTLSLTDRDGEACSLADMISSTESVSIKDRYGDTIGTEYYTVDAENSTITIKKQYFSGKPVGTECFFNIDIMTKEGYLVEVLRVNAPYVTITN